MTDVKFVERIEAEFGLQQLSCTFARLYSEEPFEDGLFDVSADNWEEYQNLLLTIRTADMLNFTTIPTDVGAIAGKLLNDV